MAEGFTPKNDDAVVLCCDVSHLSLAAFVAHQIDRIETNRKFDIIICVPNGVPRPSYLSADLADLVHIDVDQFNQLHLQRKWISAATFYRILLPDLFCGRYRKLLYLDTDMYPRRPCIQLLFDEAKHDVPLAACLEPSQYLLRQRNRSNQTTHERIKLLGSQDGRYFNAGLLLIDPESFVKESGVDRFWQAYEENFAVISRFGEQDQGAFNKAFANEMKEISPMLNWHTGAMLNRTMVGEFDPAILHFAGRYKPWNLNDDPFVSGFLQDYENFFAANGIDFSVKPALNSFEFRKQNPKYKLKVANWISHHRYLSRRLRHQRMNEFEDIAYKKSAIQTMILRSDHGIKS
jgi:lipopolysaccharide biosynthesis glycosyltransferase